MHRILEPMYKRLRLLYLNTELENPLNLILSFGFLVIRVTSVINVKNIKRKKGKRFQSKTVIFASQTKYNN